MKPTAGNSGNFPCPREMLFPSRPRSLEEARFQSKTSKKHATPDDAMMAQENDKMGMANF